MGRGVIKRSPAPVKKTTKEKEKEKSVVVEKEQKVSQTGRTNGANLSSECSAFSSLFVSVHLMMNGYLYFIVPVMQTLQNAVSESKPPTPKARIAKKKTQTVKGRKGTDKEESTQKETDREASKKEEEKGEKEKKASKRFHSLSPSIHPLTVSCSDSMTLLEDLRTLK